MDRQADLAADLFLLNRVITVIGQDNSSTHTCNIPFVIGMNQAIGDRAAIAFSVGFYRALGAGRSVKDAYEFACVEIQLEGIPGYLTPILLEKEKIIKEMNEKI
jgi:hypothetical protein